jgi:hypothetical protein
MQESSLRADCSVALRTVLEFTESSSAVKPGPYGSIRRMTGYGMEQGEAPKPPATAATPGRAAFGYIPSTSDNEKSIFADGLALDI